MQSFPIQGALPLLLSLLLAACGGGGGEGTSSGQNLVVNPNPNPNPSGSCAAAPTVQEAVDRINAARAVARQCGTAFFPATTPLVWDAQLQVAAQAHASDMANRNFFAHTNPDGVTASQRTTAAGYGPATGENIAAGYPSMEAAMQGWLLSPGHCENIMRPTYQHYALACADGAGSDYGTYWTQSFGVFR